MKLILVSLCVLLTAGCSTISDYLNLNPQTYSFSNETFSFPNDQTQAQRRSYQTRIFDISDEKRSLKIIIATLQDLGFSITKADAELGVATGKQIYKNTEIYITVTTTIKPPNYISVRASLHDSNGMVDSPQIYQDFFSYLQKAYFLADNEVN